MPVEPARLSVDDCAPLTVIPAAPLPPRAPHPGLLGALFWCAAFFLVEVAASLSAMMVTVFVQALFSPEGLQQLHTNATGDALAERFNTPAVQTAALVAQQVACLGFVLVVVRVFIGPDWGRRLSLERPGFTQVVLTILALPGLISLVGGLHTLLHEILPSIQYQTALTKMIGDMPLPLAVVLVAVAPAVTEELLFRGFLGRGLVARYGPVLGVLATSAFFGLMHLDPPYIVATAVLGIFLHFIYLMSRSLVLPMLAHGMNNTLTVLAVHQGVEGETWGNTTPAFAVAVYGGAALLMLASTWAIYRGRARLEAVAERPAWQADFPGVEGPPDDCGTVVVHPWPGWVALSLVTLAVVVFGLGLQYAAHESRTQGTPQAALSR